MSSYYEEYIEFGGFPAVAMSESNELKKLIRLLGARVGSRLNVDELSKIAGLSRPTVSSYLSFLEQRLIGRFESKNFTNFVWGGSLGNL